MEDISRQISLMESLDSETSADAINQLKTWISDGHGIPELVEYYATCQSIRALELLCLVQEPHDKILLDKMLEHLNENRHGTLVLMGRIIQRAPGWLAKIPHHNLFRMIIESIQINGDKEYISSAILFTTSLMPYSTTLNETLIQQLFEVFAKACRILENGVTSNNTGESDNSSQTFINQMQIYSIRFATVKFFHALYALYPCHLVHNLRTLDVIQNVTLCKIIEEIFMTVRLHPALIFENKYMELSRQRWMTKEPHDFFTLSRKLSVDDTVDYNQLSGYSSNKENITQGTSTNVPQFSFNIGEENLQMGVDSQSFLRDGLTTPPLVINSSEEETNLVDHQNNEESPEKEEHNTYSSLLQKVGGIFKAKKRSAPISESAETRRISDAIIEHTGSYIDDITMREPLTSAAYRNVEWAIECVESIEYDCLNGVNNQEIKRTAEFYNDEPSTSGIQNSNHQRTTDRRKTSEKRTSSESYANQTISATHQFLNCRNLGRASSLMNLNDAKEKKNVKLINSRDKPNVCPNCSLNQENAHLLDNFEKVRNAYINASSEHHSKMKEFNLISRTPGRMYDDMHYIIKELPLERQCEILSARLRLVNQHLLFERYCRLLHENRNRRLFGRLKRERTDKAENRNFMELEHNINADLNHQIEMYSKLNREYLSLKTKYLQNESNFSKELEKCKKEKSELSLQMEILQQKYSSLAQTRNAELKLRSQELLQKENLMASKKLMELKLKEVYSMKAEFMRIQQEKQYLETQLKKKNDMTDLPRKRAESMVAPLYEAQLKNVRLQLRKTKMALSRAMEKNDILECRWKEELDRRFDLQSTLNRASLVHSKNLDGAHHKFNTLLAICNKQEAHIFNLHRALEQNETLDEKLSKTKPVSIEDESFPAVTNLIPRQNNTFDCDNSYIFSNIENHAKIAGLFSLFEGQSANISEDSTTQSDSKKGGEAIPSNNEDKTITAKMDDSQPSNALNKELCSSAESTASFPDDPDMHKQ